MKNIYILFTILILLSSCRNQEKKELILGDWKFLSSTNLRTNKIIKKFDKTDPLFAIINKDLIILTDKKEKAKADKFPWKIVGDSLKILLENKDTLSIYLKEINHEKMILDFYFLGKTRIILEKQ